MIIIGIILQITISIARIGRIYMISIEVQTKIFCKRF